MSWIAIRIESDEYVTVGPFETQASALDFVMTIIEHGNGMPTYGRTGPWFVIDVWALDYSPEQFEAMYTGTNIVRLRKDK